MKKLFILVQDCGDGSYHPRFTFNEKWVKEQERLYQMDKLDNYSLGVDGDGFHYKVLTVPEECTLQSLGVVDCVEEDFEEEDLDEFEED